MNLEAITIAQGKYEYWLTEDGLLLLKAWARDGLTDEKIADKIRISRSTLSDWKNKYSDISDALKKGKEIIDYEVENALLKRALGYKYNEIKEEYEQGELVKTTTTRKEVPPDVGAIAIWLKNRKPDNWRDKPINKDDDINNSIKTVENLLLEIKKKADNGDGI